MGRKLYYAKPSPPVRSTLLAVYALGIENEIEFEEVNVMAGEQHKPEFLKINPLHTVPTLQDGDFVLYESHAINSYLASKYGKDDSLYPQDLQKRALVDQRLHFDNGVLFPSMVAIVRLVKAGAKSVPKKNADAVIETYKSLETLLGDNQYVAGDHVTIADFSIVSTVTTANIFVPISAEQFPRITAWLARMQQLPYYAKGNQTGLDIFTSVVREKLAA